GDKFDALVGPWIEMVGEGYFQLSPLLNGAGEANWSAARLREMRRAYGLAVMQCGEMTFLEASEVLFQAVMIQDGELAAPILASLMLTTRKNLSSAAAQLDWLIYFTGDKPQFPT